ncbi:hypothetical protein M3P21_18580 [Ruegeria sp. 2012CJ41-6]|uniref:Uncharacterized protein n=1 Tax=Ruegeria spongiae TaxID=2942209 RepID=A0ABT0Q6P0_9RHOB|nr:hypothetical protein [Ruegeria spongiae]MCL6285541.1 hypothetical protein [Ruegeria spongiae]
MIATETKALNMGPSQPINLSDVGACRAFDLLGPDAATLLMGMIRVTSRASSGEAVIAQAAASMKMSRKAALRGFRDLRQSGLLRQRDDGVLVLHRLFSSYGHELARRKQAGVGAVGQVVLLNRELA